MWFSLLPTSLPHMHQFFYLYFAYRSKHQFIQTPIYPYIHTVIHLSTYSYIYTHKYSIYRHIHPFCLGFCMHWYLTVQCYSIRYTLTDTLRDSAVSRSLASPLHIVTFVRVYTCYVNKYIFVHWTICDFKTRGYTTLTPY